MKHICEYGCGQESKYQFKNDKWCCSKNFHSCPEMKRKNKPNLGKKFSIETRNKISRIHKGRITSEETKSLQSKAQKRRFKNNDEREKQSKRMKKVYSNLDKRKEISRRQKERFLDIKERQKHSMIMKQVYKNPEVYQKTKRTIEKIRKKYPTFFKEEEMRYNPNNLEEKEIQVRCKNYKCKNSKEQNGWFIPTSREIELRMYCLEHKNGNDGGYFYCSEICKMSCCLYRFREDPNRLSEFERYKKEVEKETRYSIIEVGDKIKNIGIRSRKYPLDHKYSVYQGFINNINSKIVGHWLNLEILSVIENSIKQDNCSISIKDLKNKIDNYNIGKGL